MMSFIDDQSYLNQEKFRGWMEGILNTVAIATTNTNNQIKLGDYIVGIIVYRIYVLTSGTYIHVPNTKTKITSLLLCVYS